MLSADDDAVNTDEAIWDKTMAVNLKRVFLGCNYGIPRCAGRAAAHHQHTASFVALLGAATRSWPTASKGGVLALTRRLAIVHAREGKDRVNALCRDRCVRNCS